MSKPHAVAAVLEIAAGLALMNAPSLVARLLLGTGNSPASPYH